MKPEQKDIDKMLTYMTMVQTLYTLTEDEWVGHPMNKQTIKNRTKDLMNALGSTIKILCPDQEWTEDGMMLAGSYADASISMLEFYRMAYEIERLDPVKRETFKTQFEILTKSYGIDLD
jgi:hypothetical protein